MGGEGLMTVVREAVSAMSAAAEVVISVTSVALAIVVDATLEVVPVSAAPGTIMDPIACAALKMILSLRESVETPEEEDSDGGAGQTC